ncbi:hypothetical protein CP061683_1273A, partial [Chlamydia psittaci 06-1683]
MYSNLFFFSKLPENKVRQLYIFSLRST